MNVFWMGVMAAASWVAALFFLRFWRETKDRLFALFSLAFLLLGLIRLALAVFQEPESQTYLYWVRLAAFLVILVAIIDKNRH